MIPEQFDYVAAKTLDEALSLLAQHPDDAKILAGGHSLIPVLKLRLAQPQLLIDLGRIKDLSYVREEGDQIRIGAMTTHYQIESSDELRQICPLLPEAASHIGDVQVRNRGTFGGSLAHGDPAGDWPAVVIALGADIVVVGKNGERVIKADDFFVDLLTTALKPDEILREVRITTAKGKLGQSYMKMHQPASGFAVVGVAASLIVDQKGGCESIGIGITGVGPKAYRPAAVEGALKGKPLDAKTVAAATSHAADGVDPNSDIFASAEYRRHIAQVYTRRAIETAAARAK